MGSKCRAESQAGRTVMKEEIAMDCTAIVLAAGNGKRLNAEVKKQYLDIGGMPVVAYSLRRFQKQEFIHRIVLVTGPEDREYCQEQIVDRYGLTKVEQIIPGGNERFDSVYAGLRACAGTDVVFIHDGARPFISDEVLAKLYADVLRYRACIAAVPVKDTIKISLDGVRIDRTPDRNSIWQAQTPQVFSYDLIRRAYRAAGQAGAYGITDDASCVERYGSTPVHLTLGSYENIKITTREDLAIASVFAEKYMQ